MNVKDLAHCTDKRKEDEDLDAPISDRKNAGNFGLEIMLLISGRKICRQFRDGRYAGNFGSEDMPVISGRKKNAGKVGSEQNVSKFGPEKNAGVFVRG